MKAPARRELRESPGATEHATVPGGAIEHVLLSPLPGEVDVCSMFAYGRFSS